MPPFSHRRKPECVGSSIKYFLIGPREIALGVRSMISLLASLHAIAAQRGDGLRPELIRLLEKPNANFGTGPGTEPPCLCRPAAACQSTKRSSSASATGSVRDAASTMRTSDSC